ncbi:MAG: G8 domain-containing protein, partial [Pseudomonadota bacterium]
MHDGMNHATMNHSAPMPSLALVPVEQATHVVVASGNWSDPATWSEGQVPGEGAHVLIPEGLSVTVDAVLMPEIKTIRADGVLDFATDVNTELRVDTLVTTETGTLRIGTANAPIDATVTARVIFADDGPIDRDWDPGLISRGALLHGRTEIFGAEKTAFTVLAEQPTAGATSLTLSTVPSGWRVGDTLSVAGTDPADPASDEIVTITAIDGATITLNRPLERDHVAPAADLDVHVANLTRNVEFTSENEGALNRGHVMFMHTNDADVRHVGFQGLGRTDKSQELTDWTLDVGNEEALTPELTEVIELGGTNVRGRYSVHFHRGGDEGPPAHVEGAVVRDDPGWAYVNHSSNVDFIGNVSHNITGAAYNTEAGDEVGSFVGNIALRTVNPGANLNPAGAELDPEQAPDARLGSQDYGWQGDGFWFHGSGVTVDDNVVSGASGHAYIYWQLGLVERGLGENMVDVANLPNGDLIGP